MTIQITADRFLAALTADAAASGLPVSAGLGNCVADQPDDCITTRKAAIETGLVGIFFEDCQPDRSTIYPIAQATDRIPAGA